MLIPRPETGELVCWIAENHLQPGLRVLDIGTGSGCIAVSLGRMLPEAKITGWDISAKVLAVAKENALSNGVEADFRQVDILAGSLPEFRADILVSNPPYVTEKEKAEMEPNVLDWEPSLALFVPDDDPLRFYRRIATIGRDILLPGGTLYFEINRMYGQDIVNMLKEAGYISVELKKDLSHNDRMIKAVRP